MATKRNPDILQSHKTYQHVLFFNFKSYTEGSRKQKKTKKILYFCLSSWLLLPKKMKTEDRKRNQPVCIVATAKMLSLSNKNVKWKEQDAENEIKEQKRNKKLYV